MACSPECCSRLLQCGVVKLAEVIQEQVEQEVNKPRPHRSPIGRA
jgi:hypothetical protein